MSRVALGDGALSLGGGTGVGIYALWDDPADDAANRAWVRRIDDALAPFRTGRYVGEADLALGPGRRAECFTPEALERLEHLRRRYDPAGRLPYPNGRAELRTTRGRAAESATTASEQKIVAAGAPSGVAAMLLSTWLLYAALPLLAMIVSVGNARATGPAIDPTLGNEDPAMRINIRVAGNTLTMCAVAGVLGCRLPLPLLYVLAGSLTSLDSPENDATPFGAALVRPPYVFHQLNPHHPCGAKASAGSAISASGPGLDLAPQRHACGSARSA